MELIMDGMVDNIVKNKQLKTLSWVLCMEIKTLSLRARQLSLVSFWMYSGTLLPPCTLIPSELIYLCFCLSF